MSNTPRPIEAEITKAVTETLTVGSDAYTIVEPRQVFRWALTRSRIVTAIVVAHGHPSGDPTPSDCDKQVTVRLVEVGAMVGIPVLDHIVFGRPEWVSMAERGLMPAAVGQPASWTA